LNGRELAETLKEQPHLTDSPNARGNIPLNWAATRGDTENLQELLKYGASTNFRNNNGWNAFYSAINHSRLGYQTVEPSAELLKAFTAMVAAVESAKQSVPLKGPLARHSNNDQDVFKDAIETQSDGSPHHAILLTMRTCLPERTAKGEQG